MLALVLIVAAHGFVVYEKCDPAAAPPVECRVLATFGGTAYCCDTAVHQRYPTQVMGLACYDLIKTPTPCPIVAVVDSAVWCCGDPSELNHLDDYGASDYTW
jgi:hypothetical protein